MKKTLYKDMHDTRTERKLNFKGVTNCVVGIVWYKWYRKKEARKKG